MAAQNSVAEIGVKLTADTKAFDASIEAANSKLASLGTTKAGRARKGAGTGTTGAGTSDGDNRYVAKGEVTFTKTQATRALKAATEGLSVSVPIKVTQRSIADAKVAITKGIGTVPVTIAPKFAEKGPGNIQQTMGAVLSMQYGISQTQGRALFKETVDKAMPKGMSSGGIVQRGVPIVMNEKRPEVFVPNTNGRILPSADKFRDEMNRLASMETEIYRRQQRIQQSLTSIPQMMGGGPTHAMAGAVASTTSTGRPRFLDASGKTMKVADYYRLPVSQRQETPLERAAYQRHLATMQQVTPAQLGEGRRWYALNRAIHEMLGRQYGQPPATLLEASGSMSPQVRYPNEVLGVERLLQGLSKGDVQKLGIIGTNVDVAQSVLAGTGQAGGRKVTDYIGSSLSAALSGRQPAVPDIYTTDAWQLRMLLGRWDVKNVTASEFWAARTGGLRAAQSLVGSTGLQPFQQQAATWTKVRQDWLGGNLLGHGARKADLTFEAQSVEAYQQLLDRLKSDDPALVRRLLRRMGGGPAHASDGLRAMGLTKPEIAKIEGFQNYHRKDTPWDTPDGAEWWSTMNARPGWPNTARGVHFDDPRHLHIEEELKRLTGGMPPATGVRPGYNANPSAHIMRTLYSLYKFPDPMTPFLASDVAFGEMGQLRDVLKAMDPKDFGVYHASTDVKGLLSQGFRTANDLRRAGIKPAGLGGTDDIISTAFSRARTEHLAETMRFGSGVARGEHDLEDVLEFFRPNYSTERWMSGPFGPGDLAKLARQKLAGEMAERGGSRAKGTFNLFKGIDFAAGGEGVDPIKGGAVFMNADADVFARLDPDDIGVVRAAIAGVPREETPPPRPISHRGPNIFAKSEPPRHDWAYGGIKPWEWEMRTPPRMLQVLGRRMAGGNVRRGAGGLAFSLRGMAANPRRIITDTALELADKYPGVVGGVNEPRPPGMRPTLSHISMDWGADNYAEYFNRDDIRSAYEPRGRGATGLIRFSGHYFGKPGAQDAVERQIARGRYKGRQRFPLLGGLSDTDPIGTQLWMGSAGLANPELAAGQNILGFTTVPTAAGAMTHEFGHALQEYLRGMDDPYVQRLLKRFHGSAKYAQASGITSPYAAKNVTKGYTHESFAEMFTALSQPELPRTISMRQTMASPKMLERWGTMESTVRELMGIAQGELIPGKVTPKPQAPGQLQMFAKGGKVRWIQSHMSPETLEAVAGEIYGMRGPRVARDFVGRPTFDWERWAPSSDTSMGIAPVPRWYAENWSEGMPYPGKPRKMAAGGGSPKGLYIVGEIGEELFVPKTMEEAIPKDVMDQIPKAMGGAQVIGKKRNELWAAPEDGWIIPNRLLDKVDHLMPHRVVGGPANEWEGTPWEGNQPLPQDVIDRQMEAMRERHRQGPFPSTASTRVSPTEGSGLMGRPRVHRGQLFWNPRASFWGEGHSRMAAANEAAAPLNVPATPIVGLDEVPDPTEKSPLSRRDMAGPYRGAYGPPPMRGRPYDFNFVTSEGREPPPLKYGEEPATSEWRPGENPLIGSRGVSDRFSGPRVSQPFFTGQRIGEDALGGDKVLHLDQANISVDEAKTLTVGEGPKAGTPAGAGAPAIPDAGGNWLAKPVYAGGKPSGPAGGLMPEREDYFRSLEQSLMQAGQATTTRTPRGQVAVLASTFFGGGRTEQMQNVAEQRSAARELRKVEAALPESLTQRVGDAKSTFEQYLDALDELNLSTKDNHAANLERVETMERENPQLRDWADASDRFQQSVQKGLPGLKEGIVGLGKVLVGIQAYTIAMQAGGFAMQAIVPTVGTMIDQFRGWRGMSEAVTTEMSKQVRQAGGHVDSVVAQQVALSGLTGQQFDAVTATLSLAAAVKAGAQASKDAENLIKAATGAAEGPQRGLYGGYGGLFQTGLFAEMMGGGPGFTQTMLGRARAATGGGGVEDLFDDVLEAAGQAASDWEERLMEMSEGSADTIAALTSDVDRHRKAYEDAQKGITAPVEQQVADTGVDLFNKGIGGVVDFLGLPITTLSATAGGAATHLFGNQEAGDFLGGFKPSNLWQAGATGVEAVAAAASPPRTQSEQLAEVERRIAESEGKVTEYYAGQREAQAGFLDTYNANIERGSNQLDAIQGSWDFGTSAQEIENFAQTAEAAGDTYTARLVRDTGMVLRSGEATTMVFDEIADGYRKVTGSLVEGTEAYENIITQGAIGSGIPDVNEWAKTLAQDLAAQTAGLAREADRARSLIPSQVTTRLYGQPLVAPGMGVFGAAPTAASIAGLGGGASTGAIQSTLADAQTYQDELTQMAEDGYKAQIAALEEAFPEGSPQRGLIAEFKGLHEETMIYSDDIKATTENMMALNAEAAKAQWDNQLRLANRSLGDALGMLGEVGGTRLGYLQREQWLASRASQSLGLAAQRISLVSQELSIALQKRQIATQLAVAGFQAPGETGEERYARQREAIIRAGIQRRQVGLQERQVGISQQQFGLAQRNFVLAGQIWSENARRAATDAGISLDVMKKARTAQLNAIAAQAKIGAAQQVVGQKVAKMGSIMGQANQTWSKANSAAITGVGKFTGAVDAAATEVLRAVNLRFEKTKDGVVIKGAGLDNPTRSAAGFIGTTSAESSMIVGEAGAEHVAVLRNPRRASMMGGGGGGPMTMNININNPSVRSDGDVKRLAATVAQEVERTLARKGQMFGLRQPGY